MAAMGRPNGGPRMGDLARLVVRDYRINGRRTLWRVTPALRHLSKHLPRTLPIEDTHELSVRYILTRGREGAAASTIRYELSLLGRALTLATRSRLIQSKPLLAAPAVHNVRHGFVGPRQLDRLLSHLEEPIRSVALFGYVTGWRKSEILGLQWSQVDRDGLTLRLEPGTTKNREGRTYPYGAHPRLRRLLERLERERRGEYVFHRRGRPVKDFRTAWKSACTRADLGPTLFHDLRRSAVRNMERAGVPRSIAMVLIGHKTESIYRRYSIVNEKDLSRGVRLVARMGAHGNDGGEEADLAL